MYVCMYVCPGANYLKLWLEGGAPSGRKLLNRGGCLVRIKL